MRYLLILLPLAVAGCAYSYPVGYGYGYGEAPQYAAGYGYYGPAVTPGYGAAAPGYGYGYDEGAYEATGRENCGTPYAFKACPPLPRRPLTYYPANRS